MKDFFILLRPKHYIKNFLIFLPLFFSGNIILLDKNIIAFFSFVSFCLSASAIYIFNDYKDIDDDRKHPLKKKKTFGFRCN